MTNLLQSGAAWLGSVLSQHAAEPVTYHRGNQTLSLTVSVGRSEWTVSDALGTRIEHSDVDFILGDASELCIDTGVTVPQRGDEVRWMQGGVTQVFEVMAPAGEQVYRLDPTNTILRIHTKRIGTE